jgi:hypothetical protein
MAIGKPSDEYEADGREIWVKGFMPGETRIRPVKDLPWFTYLEHFLPDIGYLPCTEKPSCAGCNDQDEGSRGRSRKFVIPALDSSGRLNLYKCGSRLFGKFKNRYSRGEKSLTDRDYVVVRFGHRKDTDYDLEIGEAYQVDMPDPADMPNIPEILQKRYDSQLLKLHAVGQSSEHGQPELAVPVDVRKEGEVRSQRITRPSIQTNNQAHQLPNAAPDQTIPAATNSNDPAELSIDGLRAWLVEHGVEYERRAPRSALLALVQENS